MAESPFLCSWSIVYISASLWRVCLGQITSSLLPVSLLAKWGQCLSWRYPKDQMRLSNVWHITGNQNLGCLPYLSKRSCSIFKWPHNKRFQRKLKTYFWDLNVSSQGSLCSNPLSELLGYLLKGQDLLIFSEALMSEDRWEKFLKYDLTQNDKCG